MTKYLLVYMLMWPNVPMFDSEVFDQWEICEETASELSGDRLMISCVPLRMKRPDSAYMGKSDHSLFSNVLPKCPNTTGCKINDLILINGIAIHEGHM